MTEAKNVSLIRTFHGLSELDKARVNALRAHGVRTSHIMGFMIDQMGGQVGLAFNKKDVNNYLEHEKRARIKDGDVVASLSYLQGKANGDPLFFSRYVLFDDDKLKHLFWADGTSRIDYQVFGDVLAFDSTYKKKYNKPMVIFSGKNHHSQTVVFGCALVSDESFDAYKWVLESFLSCMSDKHPILVTDGDLAIREAIKHVFPNSTHRLCAWHLNKNANENVKNAEFLQDFQKAMDRES